VKGRGWGGGSEEHKEDTVVTAQVSPRAVPHPRLATKATLQTPTPIPERNFGYL